MFLDSAKLLLSADTGIFGRDARNASTLLYGAAKLKLVGHCILPAICSEVLRLKNDLNVLELVNVLWSLASLGIREKEVLIPILRHVGVIAGNSHSTGSEGFTAHLCYNCVWAVGQLGVWEKESIKSIFRSSTRFLCPPRATGTISTRNVIVCLSSASALGIQDPEFVQPMLMCASRVASTFNGKSAAAAVWAAAALGLQSSDKGVKALLTPLTISVKQHAKAFELQEVVQVLQAHTCGIVLDEETLDVCWEVHRRTPPPPTSFSHFQLDVSRLLSKMLYEIELSVPLLEGLLRADIVITTLGSNSKVIVQLDDRKGFLSSNEGTRGPPSGATRIRLILQSVLPWPSINIMSEEWAAVALTEREAYLVTLLNRAQTLRMSSTA